MDKKEYDLEVIRSQERHKTIRTAIICSTILAITMIGAWVAVKLFAKEFWLEVLLLFFGPTGLVTVIVLFVLYRLSKKVDTVAKVVFEPPANGELKK